MSIDPEPYSGIAELALIGDRLCDNTVLCSPGLPILRWRIAMFHYPASNVSLPRVTPLLTLTPRRRSPRH
jgi:hypothetical protein